MIASIIVENDTNHYPGHYGAPIQEESLLINHAPTFDDFQQQPILCPSLLPPTEQSYHNNQSSLLQDESFATLQLSSFPNFNEVPAIDIWAGNLNFSVEISKAQDRTKATPWIVCISFLILLISDG